MENNQVILTGKIKWITTKTTVTGDYYAHFYIDTDKPPVNGEVKTITVECQAFGENAEFINEHCTDGELVKMIGHVAKTKDRNDPDGKAWKDIVQASSEYDSIAYAETQDEPAEIPPEQRNPIRRSKYDSEQMRAATPEETEQYWAEQGLDVSADDLPF